MHALSAMESENNDGDEIGQYRMVGQNNSIRVWFSRAGCNIYSWPSSGGLIVKEDANAAELDFLGLDRFSTSKRSSDDGEEDRFYFKMRKIGAKWWKSEHDYHAASINGVTGRVLTEDERRVTYVGWPPSGQGVWFLQFSSKKDVPISLVGKLRMAFTMDEHCRLLREYGASFFSNLNDCPLALT
jgi:hypothetical protein